MGAPTPTRELREPGDARSTPSGEARLLIITSEPLDADSLATEIDRHSSDRPASVRIVFPAFTESPVRHAMGDVDEAIALAGQRVERQLREAEKVDADVEATVGDSDPVIALQDALAAFSADEVLLVTRPEEHAVWLEDDLFERARERKHPPLTHVVVDHGGRAREVEQEQAGPGDPAEIEAEPGSRNLPRFSTRDMAGIVVAVVGTIALAVIASDCPGAIANEKGSSTACNVELLIAGGMALINVAHVIGLMFFTATRYRGPWERFFSWFSLIGTPLAIVATLIISIAAA